MNVSRSLVVRKILESLSFNTLHMMSRAAWSWLAESHAPSLSLAAPFLALPRPRATGAAEDFSAALVSTAAMVHCRRKPYISRSCLW